MFIILIIITGASAFTDSKVKGKELQFIKINGRHKQWKFVDIFHL